MSNKLSMSYSSILEFILAMDLDGLIEDNLFFAFSSPKVVIADTLASVGIVVLVDRLGRGTTSLKDAVCFGVIRGVGGALFRWFESFVVSSTGFLAFFFLEKKELRDLLCLKLVSNL
ncbi:hypothetical protein BD560DRAFT_415630 [Blakeslea trispora]|nr:hypothetical protein BD560DRAFT_415630 [Blakeslea trispora]